MHELAHVLDVVINVLIILIVIRVLLSWFPGIDPWNPLVRALRAIVDPVLRPFRPIFPSFSGIDVTPIVAVVVLRAADRGVALYADGFFLDLLAVVVYIIEQVLLAVVVIMAIIVFLRVVISFLRADPFHPAVRLIRDMSRPLVEPFRAIAPRSRTVDAAGLIALVAYIVAYVVIGAVLDRLVVRL